MATDECILRTAHYNEMQVTPVAAAVKGEVLVHEDVIAFFLTKFTATQLAASEEASVIYKAEKCKVIKNAGEAWVPGQRVYWDAGNSEFGVTNTAGLLVLAGIVVEVAASAAVVGIIHFDGKLAASVPNTGLVMKTGTFALTATTTDIVTGLTIILFAFATIKTATQGAGEVAYVTLDHGADGMLDIYGWDDAGAEASVETDVDWLVFGV